MRGVNIFWQGSQLKTLHKMLAYVEIVHACKDTIEAGKTPSSVSQRRVEIRAVLAWAESVSVQCG